MKGTKEQPGRQFRIQLDVRSGVPAYRQIIDQVLGGIASGSLEPGDKLPTVRQLAVDLSINPNTVGRAYRELEIREILTTQQGIGTFISNKKLKANEAERHRRLSQLVGEFLARGGADGFTLQELLDGLKEVNSESDRRT